MALKTSIGVPANRIIKILYMYSIHNIIVLVHVLYNFVIILTEKSSIGMYKMK